jgi:hypothetical protein
MEMVDKLYRVRSTKDEFNGHRDVEITWIAMRYDPPLRYAKAIEGLSADVEAKESAQGAVDELFTREEAEKWVEYLHKHFDYQSTEIVEEPLPLDENITGYSYPHPGGEDLLRPVKAAVKEVDYPFSFEVCGYYVLPRDGDEEER